MTLHFKTDDCLFSPVAILKQSKPGRHLDTLLLQPYVEDPNICIVSILQEYLTRTRPLRGKTCQLLISTHQPHNGVSKATVSRWTKTGVGQQYEPHSIRSAASSVAAMKGVTMHTILKTACWQNAKTFEKKYNRSIEHTTIIQYAILL